MAKVDKLEDRVWKDMPTLFWIVPSPNAGASQAASALFAHQKSAEDYARKQAQTTDQYVRVYKGHLHGTAIPQDSQFSAE